ncbi:MAG TPA: PIN domain-containing protein [Candidatus Acidoferrum sp.]|nr:PIN domain-containing protein [Candidatus Acidoferrum sp.]
MLAVRFIFVVVCGAAGYHFRPFSLSKEMAAAAGLLFAVAVILFEVRLRRASLRRLIGAAVGSIMGILGAYLTSLIFTHTTMPESTRSFFSLAIFLVMAYIGLVLGANKGDMLNLQALGGLFGSERNTRHTFKLLDTSVIIDGRVADIADAQFLDGTVIIPQFVLRELQLVADSADPLKRQRGRRGLEVLQRIQKMPHLDVQIAEDDFAQIADVDMKLIELAKRYDAKIVTNDFNLNKVATLQGIEIMNVNQLANALKPVVLPGEIMRVFILREGKEYNQGVAYLDDGTMVVVDGARKMINKTVDISVTSVHQTTAGKMIFGRYDERGEQPTRVGAGAAGEQPGGSRSGEGAAGGERPPRPLYPDAGRS